MSGLWNIKVEYNNVNGQRWNAALKAFYTVDNKIADHIIGMDNLVNGLENLIEEMDLLVIEERCETIALNESQRQAVEMALKSSLSLIQVS